MQSNNIFVIVILILLSSSTIYSQEYEFSIQVKTSLLQAESYNDNRYKKSFNFFPPLSLSLGNKFTIDKNFQLEISPGFFYGGEHFSGIDLGFFLRRVIADDIFFATIGANFHYNFGVGHGTNVVEYTPDGIYINFGLIAGIYMSKSVSFNISYFKTLTENYGYTSTDGKRYPRNLFSIIQGGFEFNL